MWAGPWSALSLYQTLWTTANCHAQCGLESLLQARSVLRNTHVFSDLSGGASTPTASSFLHMLTYTLHRFHTTHSYWLFGVSFFSVCSWKELQRRKYNYLNVWPPSASQSRTPMGVILALFLAKRYSSLLTCGVKVPKPLAGVQSFWHLWVAWAEGLWAVHQTSYTKRNMPRLCLLKPLVFMSGWYLT